MREKIYTIPIHEVFEPKDGCPICRLRDMLEERYLEYVMGAAMMEPDVRIETNRLGFCPRHFSMMLRRKNRLSLALMLESHLQEIQQKHLDFHTLFPRQGGLFRREKEGEDLTHTCFVCHQMDQALERMLSTTVRQFQKDEEFCALFAQQEGLCYPHYLQLVRQGGKELGKKDFEVFGQAAMELTLKYLAPLQEDVSHFCKMFDYRNGGGNGDWGTSKDSIERAIRYLTGREDVTEGK